VCFGGDGGAAAAAQRQSQVAAQQAAQQAADEQARQDRIKQGQGSIDSAFSGFDQNFYDNRAKAYEDYANPQLDDKFQQSRRDLMYALARNNILDSSEAARATGQLEKDYNTQKQSIVDTGQGYANQARSQVESNRTDLVNELTSSADPNTVASQAQSRAGAVSANPTFSPLGAMFQNLAAAYNGYNNGAQTQGIQNYIDKNLPTYQTGGTQGSMKYVS
jgi:hypothetical protein